MHLVSFLVPVVFARLRTLHPAKIAEDSAALGFLAKLQLRGTTIASGALYRQNIVITTATKLQMPKTFYTAILQAEPSQSYAVRGIKIHEGFSASNRAKNDIAIVYLRRSEDAWTGLRLDDTHLDTAGLQTKMVGWGEVVRGRRAIEAPLEIDLPLYDAEKCSQIHKGKVDARLELCAGNDVGNHDAHYFSNGSPLLVKKGDAFILAGVFAWAETYDAEYYPNVYTRIATMRDWILARTAA